MHHRFMTSGISCLLALLGSLIFPWTDRAQGTVLGYQKISDTAGNFTAVIDNLDELGGATAFLGDLDGAGPSVAALAVGAVGDDDGGGNRGAVYILFLDATGTVLSYQKISDTAGNFTAVIDNADDFGSSIAALGDLDGAGPSVAALAVGAVGDDDGGINRGAVYVLFLASTGNVLSFQKISDTAGGFTAVIDDADEFGGAVAGLGDLDGAGASVGALAVGSIGDDDGGGDRGAAYVLFLASTGNVLSYQKISSTQGGFAGPLDNADEFGSSLAGLGDLDGTGASVGALAVGASFDDDGGSDRGAVYVLFLAGTGSVLSSQKISSTQGGFTGLLDNADEFGGAAASWRYLDTLGAGVALLAVSAIGDDDGGFDRGAVHVLVLARTGKVLHNLKISDTQGNFTGPLDDGDDFGASLAAVGDLDGAGSAAQVLMVGAPGDDDGGGGRGAVWGLSLAGLAWSATPEALPAPPEFVLGAARPNPFNPRTTIPFAIGAAGQVRIDIADAGGRVVRRLVQGNIGPGEHTATWDGRDNSGRSLASGVYFYRMSVNGLAVSTAGKAVLLE